jgi:hypothetical protein
VEVPFFSEVKMFGAQTVESPQRKVAVLGLTKTGLGTPVLSGLCAGFCSIAKTGTGVYEITVNTQRPFAQLMVGSYMLHQSGVMMKDFAASTKLKIVVKTFAVDGTTAAEKDFDIVILGSYASDLIG